MPAHPADEQLLHHALDLARRGVGLVSPNPHVGAVIADEHGNIVGEGTFTYAGVKHAEVLALEAAGPKARGGTLYINLEPHGHQGRTPPCTDALIKAGIRRVVASMADPNPKVSGKGFDQLRAAGIHVKVGGFEPEARRLNEAFARFIRHGVPFVTLKSALSLDGKIAPAPRPQPNASSDFTGTWLTGEAARAHVHELRHAHDAILAGVGTILADNSLLTDRSRLPRRRPLLRVILDSHLRVPLDSRIVQSANDRDLLIFCTSPDVRKQAELERHGIRVENIAADAHQHPDLWAVLRRLAELDIVSVMIEGGSTINAAALTANLVDKLFLYYAPLLLGPDAVPFAQGLKFPSTTRLSNLHLHRFADDFALEGYLRDPYRE